jgi:beta-phosphoglucomutase
MEIKACIFDLDGVLCDTSKFHFTAWSKLARTLNVPFEEEDNYQLKGVSRVGSLQYILDKAGISLSEEEFASLMEKKNKHYLDLIGSLSSKDLLPGVLPLLKELKAAGIKIGLGSSSKNAKLVIDRTGIGHYFDVLVDGTDVVNTKPHPEVFLKGAWGLGIEPANIIVFEDAAKGVEAAKAGGFAAVGIGGDELSPWADHLCNGLHEINLEILENLFDG